MQDVYFSHSPSFESASIKMDHQLAARQNFETLQLLVNEKVLLEAMAKKVAASGLTLAHLKFASQRSTSGTTELFSERDLENRVRVTSVKKLCDRVQEYFYKQLVLIALCSEYMW